MNELVDTIRKRGVLLKAACAAMAAVLLGLWCNYAPAQAVDGSFTVVPNLVAETSLAMQKDADNVIVITVYIDRIKDPATQETQDIPGGIGSFSATVTCDAGMEVLGVRGESPYDNPSFDAGTGEFAVSGVTGAGQPDQTPVIKLVIRLSGSCRIGCELNISFQHIISADDPAVDATQEATDLLDFLRGDTRGEGSVNIVDAMYIAQYTVGLRTMNDINALNAASIRNDTSGDIINIVDAMYIAQYTVSLRDEYFVLR